MPGFSAHSGPVKAALFVPVAYRTTLWNNGACFKSSKSWGRGRERSRAIATVSCLRILKTWRSPFFSVSAWQDHLKAQSGLAGGWKRSGGLKGSAHAAQQESLVTVHVLGIGHMQHTLAEDHGTSGSSISCRNLKTAPSQGPLKAVSWAHAPEERKCK